jgi:flagellin-specific chaperone FliS
MSLPAEQRKPIHFFAGSHNLLDENEPRNEEELYQSCREDHEILIQELIFQAYHVGDLLRMQMEQAINSSCDDERREFISKNLRNVTKLTNDFTAALDREDLHGMHVQLKKLYDYSPRG